MPIYARKLSRGIRYWIKGQHLGQKYHSKAIYHSKAEAKRVEADKIKEIEERARQPFIDINLIDLCNDRLDFIKLKKSNDYYKENQRYFKLILNEWGDIPVSKIARKMVNDLLMKEATRLKKSGKSNHKANSLIRSLKALFNYGIRIHDLSIKNPVFGIELYSVDQNLKYIPSDEEIREVRKKLNPEQKFLFDFVEQSAARIMEAIRFEHKDIDGELITLYTRKAKNSNLTPRRIPKPECLDGLMGKGRVFKEWTSYPRFLEDKVSWNWHALRHRRASIWATEGMTTLELMTRLGHSNLTTTMRYLQLLGFSRA